VQYDAFVLSSGNVLECVLEMPLAALDAGRVLLICAEIRVYQLDQSVDILGSNLFSLVPESTLIVKAVCLTDSLAWSK
jgi:hypothetical protein